MQGLLKANMADMREFTSHEVLVKYYDYTPCE